MSVISLAFMQRFMNNLNMAILYYVTPPRLGMGFGVCNTASDVIEKQVSISKYLLVRGGVLTIEFQNNVPANATLNVNSQGAKAIYYRGEALRKNIIQKGDIATFVYNGTYYNLLSVDRTATTETDIFLPSDIVLSDVIDSSYINRNPVSAELVNQNLLVFSCMIETKSTMPSITIPAGSMNHPLCKINNFITKNGSWYNGFLEVDGELYGLTATTVTSGGTDGIQDTQYMVIGLNSPVTISGEKTIKFSITAYVERQ